jgi:asparagine synthase (glutamine-hydrolysing)
MIGFPRRFAEADQDVDENAAGLRERLVEATRLRFLRSDVPVGAYLSGGIDSAVTAAVIARYTDAPLHTFSLRFSDAEFDEGHYQRMMADRLGTKHEDIVVSGADIAEVFPEVVWHAETPILRAAPAPLYLLSKLVRDNGFKVVVTGEGADEVLGGYDIYREAQMRLFWSRDPDSRLRGRAAELLYPWMARSPGRVPAFARSFFTGNLHPADPAISHRPRWDSTGALRALLTPTTRERLRVAVDGNAADDLIARMPADSGDWDPLSRAQWLEMTTLLPGYILAPQGDRMLMANSVEGRFPFLGRDVVDFANTLPARHKLLGLNEKYLLKRAFADLVPEEILHRPKQPYRAPDAASFFSFGAVPGWLDEVTSAEAIRAVGLFDESQVAGLIAKCRQRGGADMGNTDNMRALAVISAQLTHQQFVIEAGAGGTNQAPSRMTVAVDMTSEKESSR